MPSTWPTAVSNSIIALRLAGSTGIIPGKFLSNCATDLSTRGNLEAQASIRQHQINNHEGHGVTRRPSVGPSFVDLRALGGDSVCKLMHHPVMTFDAVPVRSV